MKNFKNYIAEEKKKYTDKQAITLNRIMDDFIRNINKHEYVMDFTVEMSGAGFEDEL